MDVEMSVDVEPSFQWMNGLELSFEFMKHSGLKVETDGLITEAHDQTLNTRYYTSRSSGKVPLQKPFKEEL